MRIDYIDKLKGVAIVLVVIGHIIEKGIGFTDLPVNKFYGSFHMPLFMFLSGIFAYKSMNEITIVETWSFLKKKALRILLPWLTIGSFYTAVSIKGITSTGGG